MNNLEIKTVKNIGFNAFSNIAKFVMSAGASIILAQRLSASDYGVVGFALLFINFLSRFSDLGVTEAVIQRDQIDDRGLYTGYTTKFILGIVVFAIIFLLAPLAKLFFDNSAIENVIKVLSINFIITTFGFLPTCLLTRELNYKKLIIPQLAAAFANSGLSIILALMGFNYWSIVLASVAGAVVSVLAVNFIHPVKIKFKFDKILFREFMGFGANLFYSGLFIYIIFNADNIIIGTLMGSSMLGLYAIAFNWGSMVSGRLYEVVHSVLFPTFSRIQQDTNKLKESYLRVLEYITFIGVISNLTLLLCSQEFLYYVLGSGTDKWMPALRTFQIMLIYGIIRTFLEPIANVLLALGKTKLLLKSTIITGAIELIFLYPVAKIFGIEGVAILVTLSYSVQYFIYFPALKKYIDLKYSDIWCFVKPTMISVCFVVVIVSVTKEFMDVSWLSFIQKLLFSVIGYAIFYSCITKWKLLKETTSMIANIRMKTV
jgi:lipopolysaccharide exporter